MTVPDERWATLLLPTTASLPAVAEPPSWSVGRASCVLQRITARTGPDAVQFNSGREPVPEAHQLLVDVEMNLDI